MAQHDGHGMTQKFKVGDRVRFSPAVLRLETLKKAQRHKRYRGTIHGVVDLSPDKKTWASEAELRLSVQYGRHNAVGYYVQWDHNQNINPWSELELEAAR